MNGPLDDVLVLDLTRVLSGPFATQQLVDMGATIIKIEHPKLGDDTRRFGPPFVNGESTYFMSINRGKKSLAVDLKHEKGKELIRTLAKRSDVLVENFRPGTAERLGLGPDMLRAQNPKLITCSISGYGRGSKTFEGKPGYDAIIQAVSGVMALTGEPQGEPTKVGIAISDMIAGLYAAQGIIAALFSRERDGQGRHIEISMQDAMCSMLTYQAAIYFASGHAPARMGNAHPSICPYETIDTKDGVYALAVGNDAQFERLLDLLQLGRLKDDERFKTNRSRVENRSALLSQLAPKFKEKTKGEWDTLLKQSNIPGGPVLEVPQALSHPQLQARGSILEHQHPIAGKIRTIASPVRIDHQPPVTSAPPPVLGQHTREVLKTRLGMNDLQIDALLAEGVIKETQI